MSGSFQEKIKQKAKSFREVETESRQIWKLLKKDTSYSEIERLWNEIKWVRMDVALAVYAEDQKDRKQKLQQLYKMIPLTFLKNPMKFGGYEFSALGTEKKWIEWLKNFEELLKE